MLDDLYQAGTDAVLDDRVRRPMAPPPAPPKWSAWSAIPRGAAAAGAEMGAFVFTPADTVQPQRYEALKGRTVEETLRDTARDLRPDPETASTAEQLLFDFTRFAGKAVGYSLASGGPVGGAVLTGLDEATMAADDLRLQGVDLATRTKAAAVQGAGAALGVALPVVGKTLKSTAALVGIGGPGAFMGQQAATRYILDRAGYDRIGQQYDPLDPVGLAVSTLVPAGFGAYGLRRARLRAKAGETAPAIGETNPATGETAPAQGGTMPEELVDAARVQQVVEARRSASLAEPGDLPAAQRHEDAMARAEQQLAAGEPVQITDLAVSRPVESLPDFLARNPIEPEAVPPEVRGNFLGWLRDRGGIDISQKLDITGEGNAVRANPGGVFRRGGLPTDELAAMAADAGYLRPDQAGDSGALVELVKQQIAGGRVLTFEEQTAAAARAHAEQDLQQRLATVEERLQLLGVDTKPAAGNVRALEAYAQAREPELLAAALDHVRAARAEAEADTLAAPLRERAQQIAQDIEDGGRTLASYEAEVAPLSPVMRRLVEQEIQARESATEAQAPRAEAQPAAAGDAEAGAAAPAARPADAGRGADLEAAGVEAQARADAAAAPGIEARLAEIERDYPDLQVMLDGMEKPQRLVDFLREVQREADELQADAPLMELAAQCALLNGT